MNFELPEGIIAEFFFSFLQIGQIFLLEGISNPSKTLYMKIIYFYKKLFILLMVLEVEELVNLNYFLNEILYTTILKI